MNSPQGSTHDTGKEGSVCLSTQSITHANSDLLGQKAHTGRMPVHPRNAHKHRPNGTETVITPVYTDAMPVCSDHEHT